MALLRAAWLLCSLAPMGLASDDSIPSDGALIALRWLAAQQSANGMWDETASAAACPGHPRHEALGPSRDDPANILLTAQVALAFIAIGYDHVTPNRYRSTTARAVHYLLAQQGPDGGFGTLAIPHACATWALAEAYFMTLDPALQQPLQRAVDVMCARQSHAGGLAYAWNGSEPTGGNDIWPTMWNVVALHSAQASGLSVGDSLSGAQRWLDAAWKAANPLWPTFDPVTAASYLPARFDGGTGAVGGVAAPANSTSSSDGTCPGAVCAVYLGHHAGDVMLETLGARLMGSTARFDQCVDPLRRYLQGLSLVQLQGPHWTQWRHRIQRPVIVAQRRDATCVSGSWDPVTDPISGATTRRVLTTGYNTLIIELSFSARGPLGGSP